MPTTEELQNRFSFWVELAKLKDTHGLDTDLMYVKLQAENHPAVEGLTAEEFTKEIDTLVWALQNQHRVHELPPEGAAAKYLSMVGAQ
jgi:hypothetical protein